MLLFPFRKPCCGAEGAQGCALGLDFVLTPLTLTEAHQDESVRISPVEHPLSPGSEPCVPAPPLTHLPLPPNKGSAISTHLPAPHVSWGAYFQQLASFPNLPLPICCYQASSLLILLNFYLFPLGCLRQACVSLHMPKHLLSSALGWFLPLSSCRRVRAAVPCFGRGTRGSY